MTTNNNDVLSAFINQTYGSIDNARKADELADLNPNAYTNIQEQIGNPEIKKKADNEAQKKAIKGHFQNKPIKESMHIPTKIKDDSINNETHPHNNLKNYNHSLETSRSNKLGLILLREMPTGEVDSLYDNIFNDNSNLVE
jgi:hypothetical protein